MIYQNENPAAYVDHFLPESVVTNLQIGTPLRAILPAYENYEYESILLLLKRICEVIWVRQYSRVTLNRKVFRIFIATYDGSTNKL